MKHIKNGIQNFLQSLNFIIPCSITLLFVSLIIGSLGLLTEQNNFVIDLYKRLFQNRNNAIQAIASILTALSLVWVLLQKFIENINLKKKYNRRISD